MQTQRMLGIGILLLIGIVFLQYRLWFNAGGVQDLMQLKKELAKEINHSHELRERNDALLAQIRRLQNSQEAIEARARTELGMVKKDETFYQVVH